jgi:hypothetical protein
MPALRRYSRRTPEKSALYKIVYNFHEKLGQDWEAKFQHDFGLHRKIVKDTFKSYLNCGILSFGAARAYCSDCKHSELIAFSCKCRGVCPSCGAKRAVIFAQVLESEVLAPVPLRHIVWTLPKRIRVYFKYDRKLHDLIFESAWKTLVHFYGKLGTPGAVMSLQTSGEALNHQPHIHSIVADGYFDPSGNFQQITTPDTTAMERSFAFTLLTKLEGKGLLESDTVSSILEQQHTGFGVWAGEVVAPEDQSRRLFQARYIDRCPLSLENIKILQSGQIKYLHDSPVLGRDPMDPLLFLAKLSVHIPNKWEQIVRYYGWFSARTRGKRRKIEAQKLARQSDPTLRITFTQLELEPRRKPSGAWADCIKRIYEINPLLCPKCNSEMKIIAFIQDPNTIRNIMLSQNIPIQLMPPPITSPPHLEQTEIWTDIDFAQAEPTQIIQLETSENNSSEKLPAIITADELLEKSKS